MKRFHSGIGSLLFAIATLSLPDQTSAQQAANNQQKPSDNHSSASPIMTREGDQQAQGGAEEQKEQNGYWENIFRWIDNHDKRVVAVATTVMAAFTVVLAIATYGLWNGARKHSERELRAYVSITEIGTREFVPNGRPETKITIKNSGKTPAYDLRTVTTFDIHKIPRDEFRHSSAAQSTDESTGALGPGVEIT